ncbi:TadE/TadG family type IV pilus assembly protein [Peristeroidobacter soli]|jgi:Flp pilus assembly protein TadG|uniref:TadE/TadG family type IV pilus assembly protein n=1 Tax=Peristeroidobacter soli TaxID=2497877 RepID=UPI0013002848|nr:TadE/TadG family type IV pilus assembly protein [Peristeroidobacter soli]
MHSRRASALNQWGVATIEFAICAPVLFFLMLATAEVGRAIFQYNTLVKAVRDGARYAANNAAVGTTRVVNLTAARINETRNLVVTGNIAGTGTALLPGLTVNNVTVANAGNGFISVAASYTYTPMLGATLPMFPSGTPINLSRTLPATVLMRAL